jgi:hypothetical protein
MACDDAVLAETASPRAYAACLATLAEKSFLRRSAALAQAAVSRIRQTTLRIAQILDVNRPKAAAPARKSAVALVGAFACACLGLASQVPRMVSFEGAPPAVAAVPATPAVQDSIILATARTPQFPKRTNASHLAHAPVIQASLRKTSSGALQLPRRANPPRTGHPLTIEPRLVHAKAAVSRHTAFTTGVLIIVVDDPVFGPTPIVYRFAVWQIAPSQTAGQETPQKIT